MTPGSFLPGQIKPLRAPHSLFRGISLPTCLVSCLKQEEEEVLPEPTTHKLVFQDRRLLGACLRAQLTCLCISLVVIYGSKLPLID